MIELKDITSQERKVSHQRLPASWLDTVCSGAIIQTSSELARCKLTHTEQTSPSHATYEVMGRERPRVRQRVGQCLAAPGGTGATNNY